ncbi:hypothetical protein ACTMTF_14265 [Nonomuraea sp. ZG12]|uniref:hypothetical protein n=1 Tax=Nonomuraea sp. ZG12 TaxID=3452207 RepID=UPI003F8C805C
MSGCAGGAWCWAAARGTAPGAGCRALTRRWTARWPLSTGSSRAFPDLMAAIERRDITQWAERHLGAGS